MKSRDKSKERSVNPTFRTRVLDRVTSLYFDPVMSTSPRSAKSLLYVTPDYLHRYQKPSDAKNVASRDIRARKSANRIRAGIDHACKSRPRNRRFCTTLLSTYPLFPSPRNKIAVKISRGIFSLEDVSSREPSHTDICPIYSAPLLKAEASDL